MSSDASVAFDSAGESADLTATVTSPAGTVSEGTVTFTILSGTTTIGTAQSATVSSGTASTSYPLPPGLTPDTYTIQAVYNATADFGGSSDSTHTLTVTLPVGTTLVIHTEPQSKATAGQPFVTVGQPVVVDVEDQDGNIETGINGTVITASLGTGAGTLLGTTTATVTGGVATFTDLYEKTAETITLVFSGGGVNSSASDPIVVGPGAAARLAIQIGPYATVTAGNPLTDPIVIDEEDQYGNLETGDDASQVTASLASGAGTLYGTTTATVEGGVATFNRLVTSQ